MGLFFNRKEIEREQFAQRLDYLDSELEKLGSKLYDLYQNAPLSKQVEFANNLKLADEKINKYATRQIGIERDLNDIKTEFLFLKTKVEQLIDFANNSTIGDNSIYQTAKRIVDKEMPSMIQNEVAKQIQSAKAVEKAHETNPSLAKRMQAKRIRRVGTYAERQYNEPFQIAWAMKNNGYTRAQIANVLNAKGFKTPQSNEFSKAAVTDLMHNLHQKKQMEYKQTKITNFKVTSMPKSVDFLDGIQ